VQQHSCGWCRCQRHERPLRHGAGTTARRRRAGVFEAAATLPRAPDGRSFAISHLGALHGHADQADCVASVRSWFPLYSGGLHDSLAWVEVSVYPLEAADAGANEEDSIAAPQLEPARLLALRQTLAAARHFDGHGLGRWRTLVRFGQPSFRAHRTSWHW
jgi:hypothetical protein